MNKTLENLEIKGFDDRLLGLADRSLIHFKGLPHQSIHLWIYNSKNKTVLIQKRSKLKDTYPGFWDVSVAGHIDPGEKPQQTCTREAQEEMGISIDKNDLSYLGRNNSLKIHNPELIDVESQFLFLLKLENPLTFKFNPEEISEIEWIPRDDLFQQWKLKKKDLIPRNQAYQNLLKQALD